MKYRKEIIIAAVIMAILLAMMGLMGCASARVLYHDLPTDKSKSALVEQGGLFNKEPIVGKGWEAIVYGEINAKVTKPDGTIVEVKTMKSSFLEKMLGWMTVLKPNNVGLAK